MRNALSAELFQTLWQHFIRILQQEKVHFVFFLFVYTICKKETAKILRKIKATLTRNKKSRSKHKQAQQQQAEQQQQPQHKRPPSSCSQQGDDCEKHLAAMESNLNRMINQSLRHPLSGQLSKYTNVMKGKMRWINITTNVLNVSPAGWQYRWFTVDAKTGYLSYFLCDSSAVGDDIAPSPHVLASAPRGQVQLAGAVVYPSDEDSRTFSVACASGDTVKLRANDARARQEWVDGLRAVVESHTKAMDISNSSPLPPRELLAASDAMVSARQALFLTEQW